MPLFSRRILLVGGLLLLIWVYSRYISVDSPVAELVEKPEFEGYVRPVNDAHAGYIQIEDHSQRMINARKLAVDRKYCGGTCRFIVPIVITEQESKAQFHFRQLAFLSGMVGRTIVLPNVFRSHLGACRHLPFSFYYEYDWLDRNKEHFNYITLDDFRAWARERQQAGAVATAEELSIELTEQAMSSHLQTNCLKHLFDFGDSSMARFVLEDPETISRRQGDYTEILKNELLKHDHVETIHLYYDRRFGFIDETEAHRPLSYNRRWNDVADRIADQLHPFVAVHWRMERLEPIDNLVPCAENLVHQLKALMNVKNVFLLTDYPHLLNASKTATESMSFRADELRPEHHAAIRHVYESVDVTVTALERPGVVYDGLPASWHIVTIPPFQRPVDASVLGIVDKLIAMRADWFLSGQPGVCGKLSSFTTRIIEERNRLGLPHDIFTTQ
ncbi:uncharacterized protein BYT42DRAFT_577116 [Radiomyces spectabilis]|uniref:uncharacterized protein n=1 Tax=Radiomyces spectabilis TaxID=64574 RepID=UPI00221F469C|nr:uncharacterized protein BYT42DRAFT_577116 [Radiomyces spectabilis]KAI8374644.1 hypothetical protein BYT42DRAFT_577116 [Radiomyces spectabilis]